MKDVYRQKGIRIRKLYEANKNRLVMAKVLFFNGTAGSIRQMT